MKTSRYARTLRLLALLLGIGLITFLFVSPPRSSPSDSPTANAPTRSSVGAVPLTRGTKPPDLGQPMTISENTMVVDPAAAKFLSDAELLEESESPVPEAPGQVMRSELFRTTFKYPLVRRDRVFQTSANDREEDVLLSESVAVAEHVLMRFPDSMNAAAIEAWCRGQDYDVRGRLKTSPIFRVGPRGRVTLQTTSTLLERFRSASARWIRGAGAPPLAEPDYLVFPSTIPDDSGFPSQWGLQNDDDHDIDAPEAWETSTGSRSVLVGVLDTGVDATHPDLRDNIWINPGEIPDDGIDNDGNGFIDDVSGWDFYSEDNMPADSNGHGTRAAGILGAIGNNGLGVAGVCWEVSIVPIRFVGDAGPISDAIDSINYATLLGVDLTSNSWRHFTVLDQQSLFLQAAIALAGDADSLFVAGSGNENRNIDAQPVFPASYTLPNIITVGATAQSDIRASFSNYGPVSVDLAAPGVSILTTTPSESYINFSGTSAATPFVAGSAALLRSIVPDLPALEAKRFLLENVDPISNLAPTTVSGGRLNVANAVESLTEHSISIDVSALTITSGNEDPYLNPGEDGHFEVTIRNTSLVTIPLVDISIEPDGDYPVTLGSYPLSVENLASGAAVVLTVPVNANAEAPTPLPASFTATFTDTKENLWTTPLALDVYTTSTLSGRVTSENDDTPLAGAEVRYDGTVSGNILTDDLGHYTILVPDGDYQLAARHAGFLPSTGQLFTVPPSHEEVNFVLSVPDLRPVPEQIVENMPSSTSRTVSIHLENFGTETISWTPSIAPGTPWMSVSNTGGNLAPTEQAEFDVVLDTTGLVAGVFAGTVLLETNISGTPNIEIPVDLTVTGHGEIAAIPESLAFPVMVAREKATLELTLENEGTDILQISGLTFSDPALSTEVALPLSIPAGESHILTIELFSETGKTLNAALQVTSDAANAEIFEIPITGTILSGASLSIDQSALSVSLAKGAHDDECLMLTNEGDAPLTWSLHISETNPQLLTEVDPLQRALDRLNAGHSAVTNAIPQRFDFSDGVTGDSIDDGGGDMFDEGNFLSTDLESSPLPYSDNVIQQAAGHLGPNGRYFTRKFDGLFVLGADLDGVSEFRINGNLGADGKGGVSSEHIVVESHGRTMLGLVKRVYGTTDSSVNHLIIVPMSDSITHTFDNSSETDEHTIAGLQDTKEIYYLLFAAENGYQIPRMDIEFMMRAFLDTLSYVPPWLEPDAYEGEIAPGESSKLTLALDARIQGLGDHVAYFEFQTNEPNALETILPVTLSVISAPVIAINPPAIDFGDIPNQSSTQQLLEIRNPGLETLALGEVSLSGASAFSLSQPISALSPGEVTFVPVVYSPTETGSHTATLTIPNNSPLTPNATIELSGESLSTMPNLVVDPGLIEIVVDSGQTTTTEVTVRNPTHESIVVRTELIPQRSGLNGVSVGIIGGWEHEIAGLRDLFDQHGALTSFRSFFQVDAAFYDGLEVIVIDSVIEALSLSDRTRLKNWLEQGGGLLVHSDSSSATAANAVLAGSGLSISVGNQRTDGIWTPDPGFDPGFDVPVVNGSAYFLEAHPSGNAQPLLLDEPRHNQPREIRGAVSEYGKARAAFLGDEIANGSNIPPGDHASLYTELVEWLAHSYGWMDAGPSTVVIDPQSDATLILAIDATDQYAGTHAANLRVKPAGSMATVIPVEVKVSGQAQMTLSPDEALAFPETFVSATFEQPIEIGNQGRAPLIVEGITFPDPGLSVRDPLPLRLNPGESASVTLDYTPETDGAFDGVLTIFSNDSGYPEQTLPVSGSAVFPPEIQLPSQLFHRVTTGQTRDLPIAIANSGPSILSWDASVNLDWLSIAPAHGYTDVDESVETILTADAASQPAGSYDAEVTITSNDPAQPTVIIPLHVEVINPFPLSLYDTVRDAQLPGELENTAPLQDWDQDEIANAIEFFFAEDLAVASEHVNLPKLLLQGDECLIRYKRRSDVADGLLQFYHSNDNRDWKEMPNTELPQTTTVTDHDDGTSTVEIKIDLPPGIVRQFFHFRMSVD